MAYSKLYNEELSDGEKLILCANEIMEYALRYPEVFVMLKEATNSYKDEEMAKK